MYLILKFQDIVIFYSKKIFLQALMTYRHVCPTVQAMVFALSHMIQMPSYATVHNITAAQNVKKT